MTAPLCERETCCDEKTPQPDGPACWNGGACGCKVIPHPHHPTTYMPNPEPYDWPADAAATIRALYDTDSGRNDNRSDR